MGIKAHYLQDNEGNKFYPFSHIDATYDKNGQIVGTRLDNIEKDIKDKAPINHTHTTDDINVILEFENANDFPEYGIVKALYIDTTNNQIYRWSSTELKYYSLNSIDTIKLLNGRSITIVLNSKTELEWSQEPTYIPADGEICIYSDLGRAKLGNGITTIAELDFIWLSKKDIESMTHAHTNNDILNKITAVFTTELEAALNELIAKNGEENVQSDWSETDESSDTFIKNKPSKLSQFENDKSFITTTELEEAKTELNESTDKKVSDSEEAMKQYAKQIIDKVMGNITDEKLDTLEELANAIKENDSVMDALTEAIGLKAEKSVVTNHINNNLIHITPELKEKWDQGEKNQEAYARIAVDNEELLASHRSRDILNFEKSDGIEFEVEDGNGETGRPYDTIKIKNTRPVYKLIAKSDGNNSIQLVLSETFPLTGEINKYIIPIKVTGITNISCDNTGNILIDTPEVKDISGNAGTADRLKVPRNITISIGSLETSAYFDGSQDVKFKLGDDEIILNGSI